MVIVGLFSWWYGTGWLERIAAVRTRLAGVYDYFSIDLLVRTLFAPFRQISAGSVRGPIGLQLRAWFDRLISRTIGMIVRTIVIIIGIITLLIASALGLLVILLWPLIPVLPAICVVLAMMGWIPWRI